LESEALNDLPTRILTVLGVQSYPSSSPALHNPKTFDDSGDESDRPSWARTLRKPTKSSKIKRQILNAMYDIGAVLSVIGVFVALVTLLLVLIRLMGKMYNLSFTLKQTSPAPDYDNLSYAAFTAPRQLVKRAKLPTPETISYPHPAGIQSNRSTDLKKEADPMPLQLTASHSNIFLLCVVKKIGQCATADLREHLLTNSLWFLVQIV
jgi:Na+-transporting methylmalonyl-CoA/oxaloacetate decarboxylase gamma subunit